MEIVYVLSTFPNLTETFIRNEILDLKRFGINIKILAVNKGDLLACDDRESGIETSYFYKHLSYQNLKAHAYLIKRVNWIYFNVLLQLVYSHRFSFKRLLSNLKALSIAVYFLFLLKDSDLRLFHAHFINFPATIAFYMSQLSGIPFSCTAHANDIYKGWVPDIIEKIERAKFIVTCTKANKQYLSQLCSISDREKIHHIYHGIDEKSWTFKQRPSSRKVVQIVSVARLVEKKGLIYLLEAIEALLESDLKVHCSIVGDGPLFSQLYSFVKERKIEEFVTFCGALPHSKLRDIYEASDFFILPCKVSRDGDRDGLPNVLLEAMSLGIPIITTPVSAIPELVIDRVTGVLVMENDAKAIVNTVLELVNNPQLCKVLAKNGRKSIESEFNIQKSTNQLVNLFSNA